MKRHSPAPSLGRSDVGSTQQAAIQFARMNVASSAIADIGAGWVLRQQCYGLLTVAASSSPTAASCIYELTLPTRCSLSSHSIRGSKTDVQARVRLYATEPAAAEVRHGSITGNRFTRVATRLWARSVLPRNGTHGLRAAIVEVRTHDARWIAVRGEQAMNGRCLYSERRRNYRRVS
jgi:hypothetical protein